jgi:WS/DGAT/MGAT family acyltransferase
MGEHIHRTRLLAPGGEAELRAFVGELLSTPVARDSSPWDIHLIDGLEGGGGALALRLMHCLADGSALLHLFDDLVDGSRSRRSEPPKEERQGPSLRRTVAALDPRRTAVRGAGAIAAIAAARPDPHGPLKGELGVRKQAAWTAPIPLERLKALRGGTGSTVNDVLLSATAGALSRYFATSGSRDAPRDVRVLVPVDLRALSAGRADGNHFGLVYLSLSIGPMDPLERLHEMHRRTEAVKASGQAPVSYAVLGALGLLPAALQVPMLRFFGARGSAIVTNVPGPRQVHSLAGRRIERVMFWVPQAARVSVGFSLMSYAGTVQVGVSVDERLVPDPQRIIGGFEEELRGMARSVGSPRPAESLGMRTGS